MTGPMTLAFVLLAFAICSVWIPAMQIGAQAVSAWMVFFIGAVAAGFYSGILGWQAIVSLGLFWFVVYGATRTHGDRRGWPGNALLLLTLLMALALAMHLLPGFYNHAIVQNIRLSPDAALFTQYVNFDKGAVGLLLLAHLCRRSAAGRDWRGTLQSAAVVALATVVLVFGAALVMGYVRFEPKLIAYTPAFLAINLFFTVVAEEAFFRGLIQERLAGLIGNKSLHGLVVVTVSALLFGIAHIGGGVIYFGLATLAGLGSAIAYARTSRIESAIAVHFGVNAVHFVLFTYPHVQ